MKKLILASTSPRRKEIMEKTGLAFEVQPSDYKEDMTLDLPPLELAKVLSLGKAQAVADKCENSIVIGADTIVVFENQVLGKPKSKDDAKSMLQMMSGKINSVITGFTIIDTESGKTMSDSIESVVTFKKMSESEIDNYIKSGEPMDKAGAYAIQGLGGVFVKEIKGDFFTIMGLPLFQLSENLKEFGINIL